MIKVAAVQMCSSHLVQENLATAGRLIAEATRQQAQLVVLPENFAFMGLNTADAITIKEDFGHGPIQTFLAQQAKQYKVWLVGGSLPLSCDDPHKITNTCLVFDDNGNVRGRYDKIHLFDATITSQESYCESSIVKAGTNTPLVIDTPFAKIGVAICYDIRFPELFRYLFNQGAEIIALPTAFTQITGKAHWHVLVRARAIENFCYFIGATQGGIHSSGRRTFGHSIIVDPWGNVVAEKHINVPGVITSSIDEQHVAQVRKSFPVSAHQKIFFDLSKLPN